MALEGNRQFWEEFIEMYRSLPCLWNMNSSEYKNKNLRSEAYGMLVKKCKEVCADANKDYVTKKINNLRSGFRREMKKVNESKAMGHAGEEVYHPRLWYYDILQFTADHERKDMCIEEWENTEDGLEEDRSVTENFTDDSTTQIQTVIIPAMPAVEIKPQSSPSPSSSCRCERGVKRRDQSFKKRKSDLIDLAYTRLSLPNQTDDEFDVIGKRFAFQLRKMDEHQRLIAEKIIYDVMFHGRLGRLTESSGFHISPTKEQKN